MTSLVVTVMTRYIIENGGKRPLCVFERENKMIYVLHRIYVKPIVRNPIRKLEFTQLK